VRWRGVGGRLAADVLCGSKSMVKVGLPLVRLTLNTWRESGHQRPVRFNSADASIENRPGTIRGVPVTFFPSRKESSRGKKLGMAFEPCLPSRGLYGPPCVFLARKAPQGSNWVHEIKHDGYRMIARRDGNRVRRYTHRGYDWSGKYPRMVESLCRSGSTHSASFPCS
jgi:hypothetical protein